MADLKIKALTGYSAGFDIGHNQGYIEGREYEQAQLVQPQADLKASIEERGAVIADTDSIATYAAHLKSCPYVATGTFEPTEDTDIFEVRGLPFTPTFFILYVVDDITDYTVGGVCKCTLIKNGDGFIRYMRSTGKYGNSQLPYAAAGTWFNFYDDGIDYCIPADIVGYLRAGYTYKYILA